MRTRDRRRRPDAEAEARELARIRRHREYSYDLRDPRVIGPTGGAEGIPNRQVSVPRQRAPLTSRLLLARFARLPGRLA